MSTRKTQHLSTICFSAILISASILTASLQAQSISTAQLSGTVRDQTGAAIPKAAVTVTDESKGFSRSTASDDQGDYQLLLLPPNTYTVTATASGFNTFVSKNVVLTTGEQAKLPLSLTVGSTETVTVTSGADIIETQRSSQSTTVDQMRINNLPINGRNYINFTLTNSQIARDAAPSIGAGRNVATKPYVVFTDLRIAKAFTFAHDLSLQVTTDIFNIINKNNTLDVNLLYTAAGQETAASEMRQFQFGARLSF